MCSVRPHFLPFFLPCYLELSKSLLMLDYCPQAQKPQQLAPEKDQFRRKLSGWGSLAKVRASSLVTPALALLLHRHCRSQWAPERACSYYTWLHPKGPLLRGLHLQLQLSASCFPQTLASYRTLPQPLPYSPLALLETLSCP